MTSLPAEISQTLQRGVAIPAHPLALTQQRKLDERRQRALARYYVAAGSGGLAVGVHTTQFQIRDPKIGLYKPVLSLAAEEMDRADAKRAHRLVRIAGLAGPTAQATAEAATARDLGYHAGLLSLAAMKSAPIDQLIDHCKAVADVIPVFGFYLQPSVGGCVLPFKFWKRFAEIPNVVGIKMAPFNRYQTLDVLRGVAESGRTDIALYTGNDDNIVMDLVTPHRLSTGRSGEKVELRIIGGLLGHWSVWNQSAVSILDTCHRAVASGTGASEDILRLAIEVTDCNAAFFDVANAFAGCIAGLHEVLRRQGLLENILCLDEHETLGPGQLAEIDRVYAAYPHLNDDAFVAAHRDAWLAG